MTYFNWFRPKATPSSSMLNAEKRERLGGKITYVQLCNHGSIPLYSTVLYLTVQIDCTMSECDFAF